MQFAIAAFLKPGAEDELIKYSDAFNERLGESGENVLLAGVLRDQEGRKRGYLAIIQAGTMAEAKEWIEDSPITRANLHERVELFEYRVEVGRVS